MTALTTLVPVFFMLGLGHLSRRLGWLSPEQAQGANSLVFGIFFPIMIYNLVTRAQFEWTSLSVLIYVILAYCMALVIGRVTVAFTGKEYRKFSYFLLPTNEGGNVALPLYLSIVGVSSHTVLFDIASSFIAFMVLPIIVARVSSKGQSRAELLRAILTHPFVIAIAVGLFVNVTGLYGLIQSSAIGPMYQGVLSHVTSPILGVILFVLGYEFKLDLKTLGAMSRLLLVRVAYHALVILGFFLLFPQQMADKSYMMAVLIYFMCPTSFGVPTIIQGVLTNEAEKSYCSTFISLQMLPALIAYSLVVIFVA